jgi:hypothetical protein
MRTWRSRQRVIVAVAALTMGAGCATASGQRPVEASNVNPNRGSLEAVHRQLSGTWELVSLTVVPTGDAVPVPVAAVGTLTYDKDGNLTIDAHTSDSYAPQATQSAGVLSFKGKVIDAGNGELKLTDITGTVDPKTVASPEWRRRYAFEGDLLRLSSIDAAGRVSATSTWRRR